MPGEIKPQYDKTVVGQEVRKIDYEFVILMILEVMAHDYCRKHTFLFRHSYYAVDVFAF